MKKTKIMLGCYMAVLLASCAKKEAQREAPPAATQAESGAADEEASERRRSDSRDEEQVVTGIDDLVASNNEFAFDLYKTVRTDDVAISPHGVASTLALAYAGAEGETADQIASVLQVDLAEADLHDKFSRLHTALRQREKPRGRQTGRAFRLRVINGVWHTPSLQVETDFLRVATNSHFAERRALDFANQPEKARAAITEFVRDATAGKVENVLRPGDITPLTRLVLTNTVYFDAPWAAPFDRAATAPAQFHSPAGARNVQMMRNVDRFAFLDGDGFKLVELPYGGGEVVATIVLPDEDRADFDATITADYFDWMTSQARQRLVEVRLPRFQLDERYELKETLKGMGMRNAFDPKGAEFDGLARTDDPLFLNKVIHQTHIRVDEEGTEAAAATVATAVVGGAAQETATFVADRPFLFVVRDVPTGAILFMARITAP